MTQTPLATNAGPSGDSPATRATEVRDSASSIQIVERARRSLGLTQAEIAVVLQANESTLHRWRTGASRPTAVYAVRLASLSSLIDLVEKVATTPAAVRRWLDTPASMLGGRSPRTLLREGRIDFVLGLLVARHDLAARDGGREDTPSVFESNGPSESFQPTARVAAILNSTSDGFFALDLNWRFTYVNRRAARVLELEAVEVLGRRIDEVLPDSRGAVCIEQFRRAMDEQQPATFETYYPAIDVWTEVRALPSPFGLAVFFQDITARKRAEAALRDANDALQRMHVAERARSLRLAAIAELTGALAKTMTADEIGAVLVEHGLPTVGASICAISLHESLAPCHATASMFPGTSPDEPTLVLVASANARHEPMQVWQRYPLSMQAPMADVTRSGQPLALDTLDAVLERYPGWRDFFQKYGVQSLYAVPVRFDDRTLGGLVFLWSEPRTLDEGDVHFIHALADQSGVALERARLYAQLSRGMSASPAERALPNVVR